MRRYLLARNAAGCRVYIVEAASRRFPRCTLHAAHFLGLDNIGITRLSVFFRRRLFLTFMILFLEASVRGRAFMASSPFGNVIGRANHFKEMTIPFPIS